MKKYAEASLAEGSFFFNNYMMYKYYEKCGIVDSVNYYKNITVSNIIGSDVIIYETLLAEIDPDNHILHLHSEHDQHNH
ncbi:MAG: hypothetical protein LBC19_06260 [Tannerella sp.]|jgi:hypothetical protein|nr:hypothetical protein [Tannerella sp.]